MYLKPVLILLQQIFCLLSLILHRIGLNQIFETAVPDNEEVIFSAEPSAAVKAAAASMKRQLPVVDYICFLKSKQSGGGGEEAPVCAVCLQFMEARDQVRELGNCCHAFHVSCLDRWLDLGRFSCPLCRSTLLPPPPPPPPPPASHTGLRLLLKLLITGEASSLLRTC